MKKHLITSIGRTATVSVAAYLNGLPGVQSIHEKEQSDVPILFLSQLPDYSSYVAEYFEQRDASVVSISDTVYVEVNPYFRYLPADLLEKFNWKKLFLVRHPKTYLESVYQRALFTKADILLNQLPDNTDIHLKNWAQWTRFQKLCWYYAKTHEFIVSSQTDYFRFETIISEPESLKQLLRVLSIDTSGITNFTLPKENTAFQNRVRTTARAAVKGSFKKADRLDWEQLSNDELSTYKALCIPVAKKMGYVL